MRGIVTKRDIRHPNNPTHQCAPALVVSLSSRIQNQHQHHPPIRKRHVEDHDSESATGSATDWCSVPTGVLLWSGGTLKLHNVWCLTSVDGKRFIEWGFYFSSDILSNFLKI